LAAARKALRERLARRGIALGSVLTALALVPGTGQAAVPVALAKSAVRAGVGAATGQTASTASATAVALANEVSRTMAGNHFKTATALLVVIGLAVGAGAMTTPAEKPSVSAEKPSVAAAEARRPADAAKTLTIRGRIVDADDRPVPGAKLLLWSP